LPERSESRPRSQPWPSFRRQRRCRGLQRASVGMADLTLDLARSTPRSPSWRPIQATWHPRPTPLAARLEDLEPP
jgi:hypothetical protein